MLYSFQAHASSVMKQNFSSYFAKVHDPSCGDHRGAARVIREGVVVTEKWQVAEQRSQAHVDPRPLGLSLVSRVLHETLRFTFQFGIPDINK